MKLSQIEKYCKARRTVILYKHPDCDWISNGSALWPLRGLPRMTIDQLCELFALTDDDRAKYTLSTVLPEDMPGDICFDDFAEGESLVDMPVATLNIGSGVLSPLLTTEGAVYCQEAYIYPYYKVRELAGLYERHTVRGVYIAIKLGMLLECIILETHVFTDEEADKLATLLSESRRAQLHYGGPRYADSCTKYAEEIEEERLQGA